MQRPRDLLVGAVLVHPAKCNRLPVLDLCLEFGNSAFHIVTLVDFLRTGFPGSSGVAGSFERDRVALVDDNGWQWLVSLASVHTCNGRVFSRWAKRCRGHGRC